jgi:Peptidase family M28
MRGPILAGTIAILAIFFSAQIFVAQQIKFTLLEKSEVVSRAEQPPSTDLERAAQLKAWFDQAGCGVIDLTEQRVDGAGAPNVICHLRGQSSSTIVVGAHFDHATSPQRSLDNWSGAALLPGLYRCLKDRKRHFSYVFVAFADNGNELVGAKSFADHLEDEGAHNVRAMINLDPLGLSPTKIWTAHSDKDLIKTLIQSVYMLKIPASQVDLTTAGNSDSDPFAELSIPQITLHSITHEHLRKAVPSRFRPGNYYDSYRLLCGYLALLDTTLKKGSHS